MTRLNGLTFALLVALVALNGCSEDELQDAGNGLSRLFSNYAGGQETDALSPDGEAGEEGGGVGTSGRGLEPGDGSASCSAACDALDMCGILAELEVSSSDCTTFCADESPSAEELAAIANASCDELRYAVFGDEESSYEDEYGEECMDSTAAYPEDCE